jgi:hypothetical protein
MTIAQSRAKVSEYINEDVDYKKDNGVLNMWISFRILRRFFYGFNFRSKVCV